MRSCVFWDLHSLEMLDSHVKARLKARTENLVPVELTRPCWQLNAVKDNGILILTTFTIGKLNLISKINEHQVN